MHTEVYNSHNLDNKNYSWGVNASARMLDQQAGNFQLLSHHIADLDSRLGSSYAALIARYETSNPALANYYRTRQESYFKTQPDLNQIAEGLRAQARDTQRIGLAIDKAFGEINLADQFDLVSSVNEQLAAVYASMSEAQYWEALYAQISNGIESKQSDTQTEIADLEALTAQAEQYEAEFEQVINGEAGINEIYAAELSGEATAAPTIAQIPAHGSEGFYVGSSAGTLQISTDGNPTWSLPIEMPPGVRGVAPTVSLSVNATGGVSVSAASSVTRCGSNIAEDGFNRPVMMDAQDNFCYNGQRLVLINGQHGAPGAEYRTRVESFERIIAIGSTGSAPSSFEVTTRSGGKLYFGMDASTRDVIANSQAIASWRLSQLTDIQGNGIYYAYQNVSDTSLTEVVLTDIYYGAKDKEAANLNVHFEYETRPNVSTGYSRGQLVQSTKRLRSINTGDGERVLRRYQLHYEQGEVSKGSRVASIQECAGVGAADPCYRPSYFTYSPEKQGWRSVNVAQPDALQDSLGRARGVMLDINNDGNTDWITAVKGSDGNQSLTTWLGSASGWTENSAYQLPSVLFDYSVHNGNFQGSCTFSYAANNTSFCGFSATAPQGRQFRVWPDHRLGFAALAS